MRDELTFSADDNEHIPESPILFPVKNKSKKEECSMMFHNSFTPRFNSVRDELISSADDNEHAPESLILLSIQYQNKTKQK